MRPGPFSVDALPAWCDGHGVKIHGLKVADVEGRGNGWIAQEDLNSDYEDAAPARPLLVIPKDIVVSVALVMQYATENAQFSQLIHAVDFQTERQFVLSYMMMQLVLSSPDYKNEAVIPPAAWTQYIGLQPRDVPVPTMWSEAELLLLRSTSLESAVAAKMALLAREFAAIQAKTRDIPFWRELLSEHITLRDWIWVDALLRSRSFDLPYSGVAMVPCLDLANHSVANTAYWRQDPGSEAVTLLLPKGSSVSAGEEITINYGKDKPAAEMLFNYGFIDSSSGAQSLVLSLDEMLEEAGNDPFLEAKLRIFNAAPLLELRIDEKGKARWSAPFLHLMCVQKQDGLAFETQERQGQQSQRMLWRGKDITSMAVMFDVFINAQNVREVVQFRVVSVLLGVVEKQLDRIRDGRRSSEREVRQGVLQAALQLRSIETDVLERCLLALKGERDQLAQDKRVVAYTNKSP
ncbi:SET domain-containing protein [Coniochaeta ligniaria NRRL 30616]|uniref:SET domain-containing protein n=1 Tax=Coniochaeta ligniaria NRRL 30616 TaxID=1408157 RepID=A0A1J7ITZ3_9PEZI|nr:SET domain-containing protein [Coniochaeta ligniaria NRRL 30616]